MPGVTEVFDDDFNVMTSRQERGQADVDPSVGLPSEKESSTRENNVAKIKVVVRCFVASSALPYIIVDLNYEIDLVDNLHMFCCLHLPFITCVFQL